MLNITLHYNPPTIINDKNLDNVSVEISGDLRGGSIEFQKDCAMRDGLYLLAQLMNETYPDLINVTYKFDA